MSSSPTTANYYYNNYNNNNNRKSFIKEAANKVFLLDDRIIGKKRDTENDYKKS
jgi:hypothetical protein